MPSDRAKWTPTGGRIVESFEYEEWMEQPGVGAASPSG